MLLMLSERDFSSEASRSLERRIVYARRNPSTRVSGASDGKAFVSKNLGLLRGGSGALAGYILTFNELEKLYSTFYSP